MSEIKLRPAYFIKLNKIIPGKHCYNVYVKVISTQEVTETFPRGKTIEYIRALVGDETSTAEIRIRKDRAANVVTGKVIAIRNGLSSVIRDHILLQIDLFGLITEEKNKSINDVNLSENISSHIWARKTNRTHNRR